MSRTRIENNVLDKKNLPTMYDLPSEVNESELLRKIERERAKKKQAQAEKKALAKKLARANEEKERLQAEKEALFAKLKALGIDPSSL
jgi:ABC-type phosphate transport system auxiliary subunit